ncbi:MAG TPA: bifunctional diaminohydroxyphosphoribosylaminopyrimidine deaminase/5-amino-6-(5-phosphoribosylamino)uracil reductase RibD [Verrucomicrobiae bacterium]|nr:bifunctional diaminohydroxyphosphoribosylaminopyrimidine deaminase/5-amino-6-(5-phosphoribosylamino)uracil reductase RibD [Verrucomicrobiae bacterium]
MSIRSSISAEDDAFLARALELARQSVGLAHPNPVVGAVLVKDGRIVGEAFHEYEKLDHAEIRALAAAGSNARGSTLYVSLEPCCHTGRTGPCTEAILASGVSRVVAAMTDPNPTVAGRGFERLRRGGVSVDLGAREAEAQRLNEAFARWIRTGRPLVTLKTALTLDGKIAMPVKRATWITSDASRKEVQTLRHASDAVMTGIGTVLIDNPRLTDRTGLPRRRKLLRVVVDTHLRLSLKSKLVKSAENDLLVYTLESPSSSKARELVRAGAEVVRVAPRRRRLDLREILRDLGGRQILSVLIEAGSRLNGAALESRIVDKMVLFYAPQIMGTGGIPMAEIPCRWFPKSPSLKISELRRHGPDFSMEGYFHDVYGNH